MSEPGGTFMKASYTTLLVVGYANAVSVCPPNLHRLLAVRTPDLPVKSRTL